MSYEELPVFRDVYELNLKLCDMTQNFRRDYKYTLGEDMRRDCLKMLRGIYKVNRARDKVLYFDEFLDDFELLRMEVRICGDLKQLSVSQQANIMEMMDRIGKQIRGWRNSSLVARVSSVTADESEQ